MTLVGRAFDAGESLLLNVPYALPCNAVDAREFAHASKRSLLDELGCSHRSDLDDAIQLSSRCTVDVDAAASVYRNKNTNKGYKNKGNRICPMSLSLPAHLRSGKADAVKVLRKHGKL